MVVSIDTNFMTYQAFVWWSEDVRYNPITIQYEELDRKGYFKDGYYWGTSHKLYR